MNHEQVMEQAKFLTTSEASQIEQLEKSLEPSIKQSVANIAKNNSTERQKQRYEFIPQIYRQQINFEREQKFRENFEIIVPDSNCFFYRDWKTLQSAVL
ncbi:hypothetical protein, partial [Vibrio anguillarum]|uniref:hypothetical protein n=1 Tax=Vibrio anguillarum TaxID=55601 RepID=UPI001BE4986B